MIKFLGICDVVDWDTVIRDCENHNPDYIGPSHKRGDKVPGLDEIIDLWDHAGYKTVAQGGTVAWDMFIPGKQFDDSVVKTFNDFFDIDCKNVWISRIHPGKFAPIHWDAHDDEENIPECKRYHCHIGKPEWGHVFIAENRCFYNQTRGSTYEWSSRKLWHAGTNCGTKLKYILNAW